MPPKCKNTFNGWFGWFARQETKQSLQWTRRTWRLHKAELYRPKSSMDHPVLVNPTQRNDGIQVLQEEHCTNDIVTYKALQSPLRLLVAEPLHWESEWTSATCSSTRERWSANQLSHDFLALCNQCWSPRKSWQPPGGKIMTSQFESWTL